jgi:hypothetical protein
MKEELEPVAPRPGTLNAHSVGRALVGLLVVTVGVATLVGYAAKGWHGFAWGTAAVAGTAVATALLAAFTAALAYTTSGDVRATWELAELTRRDQAERERPIVIEKWTHFQGSWMDGSVTVSLVNVGLGPALRLLVSVRYAEGTDTPSWDYTYAAISPGSEVEIKIPTRFKSAIDIDPNGFHLRGSFADRHQRASYAIINRDWEEADP